MDLLAWRAMQRYAATASQTFGAPSQVLARWVPSVPGRHRGVPLVSPERLVRGAGKTRSMIAHRERPQHQTQNELGTPLPVLPAKVQRLLHPGSRSGATAAAGAIGNPAPGPGIEGLAWRGCAPRISAFCGKPM